MQPGQWHPVVEEARRRGAGRDNYFISSNTPVFTAEQMAELRRLVDEKNEPASLEGYGVGYDTGTTRPAVRRTKIRWINPVEQRWVYEIVWRETEAGNKLLQYDVVPFNDTIQLACYDAEDKGFFRWHSDCTPGDMSRKLTMVVPLSDPSEYEGGILEFNEGGVVRRPPQKAGVPVMFPAWLLHQVTPVTRGRRYSMAVWIRGPAWR
jgi:PKHD-type hydroxylase